MDMAKIRLGHSPLTDSIFLYRCGKERMQENLMRWLAGGERGISSNTMVTHLTGVDCMGRWGHMDNPSDPADLRRGRKLLMQVPELQPLFPRMATCSGPWAELVAHWQELCDLMGDEAPRDGQGSAPKTYKRMRELIDAGRRADGWIETAPGCWRGPQKQTEVRFGDMSRVVREDMDKAIDAALRNDRDDSRGV